MLQLIDWLIIIFYFAITLFIGLKYSKNASKDLAHFFLGGRNLPWYIAGLSMVATTFAADTPLAVTELVAKNGISGNWLWWNMVASGMLTTFFFANMWRRANVLTEVELISIRYSGKAAHFLRAFKALYLGIFMNCLIIGWVNVAIIDILQVFFEINYTTALCITGGIMFFTAIYSAISGYLGVALTDAVQFVIAMTGCIVLAFLTLYAPEIGGVSGLLSSTPEWALQLFPTISQPSSTGIGGTLAIGLSTFFAYIGVQWWASWYPGAEPGGGGYVAQRLMSTKNEKHAVYATLFFQVAHYCLRPWPWIIVGLCCIVLYPNLADKKLGYIMAMKQFLPTGLKGLMLTAFFAAYMSTIATQLNWGAGYIVNDFIRPFLKPQATNNELVKYSKIATLCLMCLGLAVSTQIQSISGVWSFIIECGAGLGLVLILRWYWWRISAYSEITATITPFIVFGILKLLKYNELATNYTTYPNSFFITVGVTTIAWILVTYLTPATQVSTLQSFYAQVQPAGAWANIARNFIPTQTNPLLPKNNIFRLLACWLSSIIMVYSILFASGMLIFMQYDKALIYSIVALISFFILKINIAKANILG